VCCIATYAGALLLAWLCDSSSAAQFPLSAWKEAAIHSLIAAWHYLLQAVAVACLFLATKIDSSYHRLESVVHAAYVQLKRFQNKPFDNDYFYTTHDRVRAVKTGRQDVTAATTAAVTAATAPSAGNKLQVHIRSDIHCRRASAPICHFLVASASIAAIAM
jgi:hypothetical protein